MSLSAASSTFSPSIVESRAMLRVSLPVELLRSRPLLVFWAATVGQAALWWLVPSLFYAAPPGHAAEVVAIGHEFQLGTDFGPPLAFWLAELAFTLFGRSMVGVYLLAQVCVVVTYWAVFALGRTLVGVHHAVLAVLLLVGLTPLTISTPDFGPSVLAIALVSLAILHFWRAVGEDRPRYWFALAIDLGLLILTTYAGLIALALVVFFTVATRQGRTMLATLDPWMAGVVLVILLFPHLMWLDASGGALAPMLAHLSAPSGLRQALSEWGHLLGQIFIAHIGLFVLVALASGWWRTNEEYALSTFVRVPPARLGRRFVYCFALLPALLATLAAALLRLGAPIGGTAPHVVLSGLLAVLLAGNVIALHRERLIALFWAALLVVPPLVGALAIVFAPWIAGVELRVDQPARDIGQFFSESFERRTGKPLSVVSGDPRLAELVAIASASRPSLYFYADPARSPWVGDDDIARKGAVIVWPTTDTSGTPPADIKARFPQLVPEVPRAFERPVQGRLPLLRIGWGVLRPQDNAPAR
ncbi:MAG TPA: glycosyltransferase family 39 protein [Xanthobacteraceae bacterium]|nr:glycosyltransferase family 39 protein [Xanthobacteraceae bacterium]